MGNEQGRRAIAGVAVIGGGPAGLIAAEMLSSAGQAVTIYERMPSLGRKWLMAGRGGLNLTHSEPFEAFAARYGEAVSWLRPYLEAFPPAALRDWADGLGAETFVGSSGRVFPKAMKASPLLRAWQDRLRRRHVTIRLRHDWIGWNDRGDLVFQTQDGPEFVSTKAVVLALGGASWPRLGSNGAWARILAGHGVALSSFRPSNAGFSVGWSARFRERFAGQPLKPVALTFAGRTVQGEAIVTAEGLEGGAVYALGAALRDAIASQGHARLVVDLRPGQGEEVLAARLASGRPGESLTNRLRKAIALGPLGANLLFEGFGPSLPRDPAALASAIKAVPLTLTSMQGLERAISTAGGVQQDAVDANLMLRRMPGVFVAGEMLDWEAPTGGYLLQASFATGVAAAKGVLLHLAS